MATFRINNGNLLKYKVFQANFDSEQSVITKAFLDSQDYLILMGAKANSDYLVNGVFSASDRDWSLFLKKSDVGLSDGNCFMDGIYDATVSLSFTWTKASSYSTSRCSSIVSNDITSNGIMTSLNSLA